MKNVSKERLIHELRQLNPGAIQADGTIQGPVTLRLPLLTEGEDFGAVRPALVELAEGNVTPDQAQVQPAVSRDLQVPTRHIPEH
jgi:hypothetical protein